MSTKLSGLGVETTFGLSDYLIKVKAAGAGDELVTLQNFLNAIGGSTYNPSKFSVYQHTAQTGLTTGTPTKIVFDSKHFDTGSEFSTSTYLFTATTPGFYFFAGRIKFASVSSTCAIYLYQNGSSVVERSNMSETVTGFPNIDIAFPLQLAAGDTVGLYGSQSSGSTKSLQVDSDASIGFSGFRISAT